MSGVPALDAMPTGTWNPSERPVQAPTAGGAFAKQLAAVSAPSAGTTGITENTASVLGTLREKFVEYEMGDRLLDAVMPEPDELRAGTWAPTVQSTARSVVATAVQDAVRTARWDALESLEQRRIPDVDRAYAEVWEAAYAIEHPVRYIPKVWGRFQEYWELAVERDVLAPLREDRNGMVSE